MGMSIDLHVYQLPALIKQIEDALTHKENPLPEGRSVEDFVDRVLPEFGIIGGNTFATLWCEYYSDSGYNAGSELFQAVELYFGLDDVFLDGYDFLSGANAREVLEELDIEPIGDDEDE